MADRTPGRRLLLVGYAVWAAAVIGFGLNHHVLGVWIILFAATGFATAIIEVGQKIVTVGVAPEAARGRGLGQIAAVTGVGQLVASVVMGGLWSIMGAARAFTVEAALALIGLAFMAWALRAKRSEPASNGH
jgi:MFS family permease